MGEVQTVYLGQFTDEHAQRIAAGLQEAGIVWWHKSHGQFARFVFAGDWGVRIFVDRDRHADAERIAETVTGPSGEG